MRPSCDQGRLRPQASPILPIVDHHAEPLPIRDGVRDGPPNIGCRRVVLVQPEMERWRSPLVSIPPFGRGFSRHEGLPIRCGFFEERRSEAAALRSSSR